MNSTDLQDQNHGCEIILITDKPSCVSNARVPCTDVTLTTADVLRSIWQKFASSSSIIMLNTSSCQSHHHQVVGRCERLGTRKFTHPLKTLSGAKPCVFSGKVAVGGRRWRVSVSAVSRPRSGKRPIKYARDCSESSISHKIRNKN